MEHFPVETIEITPGARAAFVAAGIAPEALLQRHQQGDWGEAADGDLIALAPDGAFAAFCRCQIDNEDNQHNSRNEGWIDALGTRRGHLKRGLGRAMLPAGMHWLKARGSAPQC